MVEIQPKKRSMFSRPEFFAAKFQRAFPRRSQICVSCVTTFGAKKSILYSVFSFF